MAIYHLSVKTISRSSGRSAPSAAAYRSGEKIYDERKDRVFNYPGKSKQVLFSEILTPSSAPKWMKDREKLWNAVEACENRKDSRVAREIELALPKELSLSENVHLLKEFVNEQFVKEGLVVDVNIHDQDRGNENIHAHVMITTRRVVGEGFDLNKARDLDKKENLLIWREEWANVVNKHLALDGHNIQIDHRSNKDQGIDLEPQNKRGPKYTRKRLIEKTQEHLEIAKENGEKIYQDPRIALHALSTQQSTFSKQDIARFVNRHTVDQEQFTRVFDKVYSSQELVILGLDQKGQERYSSREMVRLEKEMLDNAKVLSESYTHDVSNSRHDRISMAVSRAGKNIKEVFVNEEKKLIDYSNLSDEQKLAVEHITKGNDLACVLGYAGTGKSYMLGAAKEIWEEQGYKVRGLSLTGIAAQGLADGSGIKSQTIARQFLSWENNRDRLSGRDIVVLDEVGMVASREINSIVSYAKEAGAKLVITGDFNQLPPIGAGGIKAVMEKIGYVELIEVRRQKEEWQQEATKQLARGEIEAAIDSYYKKGHVHIEHKYASAQDQIVEKWAKNLTEHPDKNQIMAAFTNEEVRQLNLKARDMASELGVLGGEEHEVATASGRLAMAEHEKILFLKNNSALGVANGMLGEISAINQNEISVVINKLKENQQEITFSVDEYNHFTYGYAATVHKLQGATFDNVQILASKYFNKNLAYVAFTRHREELDIYHSFANNAELIKVMGRDGSKDTTLDYERISKEILNYNEIQPLGDLGYMAFHHRELVKELEIIGDKGVSFCTGIHERGLVAGLVEHDHKQYVVLEQEKEFKLYNQNAFYHNDKQELGNDEQELTNSIGCFVTVNKSWNETNKNFNAELHNSGLSLLDSEAPVSKEQSVFVLGRGVDALQKEIVALESKYQKPANFLIQEDIYGIYRGSASIGDKEYGLVETAAELRVLAKENFTEIEKDKWIAVGENHQAVVIQQEEAPIEYIFDAENSNQAKENFINTGTYEAADLKTERSNQTAVESTDVKEIRKMLADSAESIVEEVLGRPNERLSSASEWRYGNKGSLAISIGGDKTGVWYDFESGDSGDLIGLIQKKTGMNFPETLKFVAGRFGSAQYIRLPEHRITKNDYVENERHAGRDISKDKTSKYAEKLAAESLPIAGTIVEKYLKEIRSIQNITGTDIRYHPQVFTGKGETQKYMPAMLSLAKDKDGKIQCVQATYLDPKTAGKADLTVNKRTYASPSGALVFLQKQEEVIGKDKTSYVAEGVETGLSIKDATGNGEVVVTLGKSNFAKIEPQSVGQKVVFCLDNDGSDTHTDATINKAAERLIGFGKEVFIAIPEQIETDGQLQKTDFNDIAKAYGIDEVKNTLEQSISYVEWKENPEKNISVRGSIQEDIRELKAEQPEQAKEGLERDAEMEQVGKTEAVEKEAPEKAGNDLEAKPVVAEAFKAKMDAIVKDCNAFIDSYDYHKINLDKMLSSGLDSPYLRGEISESTKGLKQYLKDNCNDKDTLIYFRDHEKRLFNSMNTICKNVLGNTIKDFEAHDKLRILVHDRPGLYERIVTTERQYRTFAIKYLEASKQTQIARETGYDEYKICFRIEKDIKEQFDRYAHHASKDAEVIKTISTYNPGLFKHMDKQFDGMFTEALIENERREAYISKHPELNKNLPKGKRFMAVVDKYDGLRTDFNIKHQLTEKANNGNDYTETKKYLHMEIAAKNEFEEYTNAICQDIEMAKMIKNEATYVYDDINKIFHNKLANVLDENALHEQFIQTHPELGKNTPPDIKLETVMEQYKELKEVYLESCQAQEAFKDSNSAEYNKYAGITETAEEDLNRYAHEACQDKELMDQVKNQDEQTYNEMQEKYNEIERENFERMQELQKELER